MTYPLRLTGDKVVVRDFTIADVDDMQRVFGDDRVTEWLSFDSRDRDATQERIQSAIKNAHRTPRTEFYLAVALPDDDRAIGFVRLVHSGHEGEEIGCAIAAEEWGRGYGNDAHVVILDYAFRELGVERVAGWIALDNTTRMRALEPDGALGRLGFAPDEVRRDHVFINGAWRDCMLNSVSAEEWNRRRRPDR
ncbi:GNAT family N-acetyltransferase [Streptomyces sp. AV19]|uniref:GNAT family N-acetyltransferase n=1 Tax=Streptomyces sp. AV19 TaxID=2793068 RepID=UPI0018FF0981|nr:GNAT family protein [Streptomyces sp. AV19]MBH1937123.1 GNAT family N-acetyltransferase [Streptomyces sp. AV19]MDG4533148.1 GNAT family N-acetyltransferase [Streptomyces sp. AV19]